MSLSSCVAATILMAFILTTVSPSMAQPVSDSREILSRKQIELLNKLEYFTIVRMEWRKSTEGRSLALSLRDHLTDEFKSSFSGMLWRQNLPPDATKQEERARLACRLMLRRDGQIAALYLQCDLGNSAVRIIQAQDLEIVPVGQVTTRARALMASQIRTLGDLYSKARKLRHPSDTVRIPIPE